MTHRAFIAVFPPDEIVQQILFIQNKLSLFAGNVRWEKKEKFHFTLQFWGNQTEDWLSQIQQDISKACNSISPFKIAITKFGIFPNTTTPKIFWVGSRPEENISLTHIANRISSITQSAGFQPENKPFHPHITIGRYKGKLSENLTNRIETLTLKPMEFYCKYLHILKSQLANSGSTYSTLYTIPLK